MKKIMKTIAVAAAAMATVAALAGCGGGAADEQIKIAVPSDPTNEARALLLLQDQGLITLEEGAGLAATKESITENPFDIEIVEMEAAAIPSVLQDVSFAVINGNYAIGAGIDTTTALASESITSEAGTIFANVIACREGEENSAKMKALVAALSTQKVADFINGTYDGSVVTTFSGSATIPQATGDDTTITVGATPAPHAELLELVKADLAAAGWTLEVKEFNDYIQPNVAVTDGELDANYFQHISYLNDYNAQNNTTLVNAGAIHFEPMGLYPGTASELPTK
ncbi:MAG: hypothetical protein IJC51_05720 [Eggerthellaceae bacterium]|nr:hypothetical protein [Eggerthellaceae bacterium]